MKEKQKNILGETLPDVMAPRSVTKKILLENHLTRGNDELLIQEVKLYCIENNFKVPASETITRCRRSIQNKDGLFRPPERQEFFRTSAREGLL